VNLSLYLLRLPSLRGIVSILKRWLQVLYDTGIDLIEYGQTENKLHESGKISWIDRIDIEGFNDGNFENECEFELLGLRIGETPDDFSIEFEDLYVSTPLATDFWLWAEAPLTELDESMPRPGSWEDDD
jgi:hypothetical protein